MNNQRIAFTRTDHGSSTSIKHVLDSGITVLIYPRQECLTAAFGIFVRAGGWNENPKTESGISHVIEHMMFKSSGWGTTKEMSDEFARLGADDNAYTDWDNTVYHARVPYQNLSDLIRLVSSMVRYPLFKESELETEKGTILAEVRRVNDDHMGKTSEEACRNLFAKDERFQDHLIGVEEQIKNMTRDDLVRYHNQWYNPENLVLVVVGRCEPYKVLDQLRILWDGMNKPAPVVARMLEATKTGVNEIYRDSEQVHIIDALYTDRYRVSDPGAMARCILTQIYGGGMNSRLFQEIREKRGLAYASFAYNNFYGKYSLLTQAYVGTNEKSKDQVLKLITEIKDSLCQKKVDEKELERAKNTVIGLAMVQHDSNISMLTAAGSYFLQSENEAYDVFDFIDRIKNVSADAVRDAAIEAFSRDRCWMTVALPNKK